MADLKYVFEVDDKDILVTIKNHEILEKRVGSLTKQYGVLDNALNKGRIDLVSYGKAIQQLDSQIAHVENTLKKGGSAVNQMATGMNISGKAGRRMELQFQQAGYQIQDFIVQVQGGVNPLIAFSQQGSQLAGFFAGPWGAAIGLGIAALSSFAMVMLSTSEEANKTKDSIMSLAEAQKELSKSTSSYSTQIAMLKFGVDTEQEVVALKENIRLKSQLSKLNEEYINTDSLSRRQRIFEEAALLKTQLYQNQVELNKLALSRAELDTINLKVAARKRESEEYAAIVKKANDLKDSIGQAYLDSLSLSQVPLEVGIDKAAEAARLLANRLGVSLDAARKIINLEVSKGFQPKDYSGWSFGGANADRRLAGSSTPQVIKEAITGSGGGGSRITQIKETTVALQAETEANKKLEDSMNMVSSNITNAFMSMIDGSQTVADSFKNMMYNILKSIIEQSVVQPAANSITGLIRGMLGGGGGGTGSMGLPMPFAKGGVVGSPTTFQTSGGRMGLMGEAGPEAIMPLKKGANGQLGVQVNGKSGGGEGNIVVNNNINVVGSDAAMVRAEVTKMIPQITEASKSAIIDAKRRGGQMGAAFR